MLRIDHAEFLCLNVVLLVCLREQMDQRRTSTELDWTWPQEEYRAVWPSSLMLVLPESGEQRAERALKLEATVGLDMQDGSGLQRYDVLRCIQAHKMINPPCHLVGLGKPRSSSGFALEHAWQEHSTLARSIKWQEMRLEACGAYTGDSWPICHRAAYMICPHMHINLYF